MPSMTRLEIFCSSRHILKNVSDLPFGVPHNNRVRRIGIKAVLLYASQLLADKKPKCHSWHVETIVRHADLT